MSIKDRGLIKWQGFFMPEQVAMQRQLYEELSQTAQPIIDDYMRGEFDERVGYAMEYNLPVEFTLWQAGRTSTMIGRVKYVDIIAQQFRVELPSRTIERVNMSDVACVKIVED
ncbi:YolD-like family protein [Bacillus sp. JJ1503]|uniref:YolD-like family protein n=1 Tax=Bacillus sp. JJ1503 TaxID=3122956 RepID=UPI002FFE90D2